MEEKTVLVVALTPLMTTLQTMCGMSKLFLPYLTVSSNARPFLGVKAYPLASQAVSCGQETKAFKQVLLFQEASACVICRSLQ